MHIRRIELENIRSIKHLVWELPEEQDGAGWHVILGDNGSGKTSFLRGVAICFLKVENYVRAVQAEWRILRNNSQLLSLKMKTRLSHPDFISKGLGDHHRPFDEPVDFYIEREVGVGHNLRYDHYDIVHGCFSSSFGSSRKFKTDYNSSSSIDLSAINPELHRHFSLFDDSYLLSQSLGWLKQLKFEELEKNESNSFLSGVLWFINQSGFLAHDVEIVSVTSKEILVKDGNGNVTKIEEVSDGYRSVFSLCIELLRQMTQVYGYDIFDDEQSDVIAVSGIVQVDEIDAHLHPEWQRKIGFWFKKHFPNIQFIVTTHSPLICWAADSVYVLPPPGSAEEARFLTAGELNRVKYGSIQEAYMLEAFGEIDRSDEGREKLKRLSELNNKEWDGEQMTQEEQAELRSLRSSLPLSSLYMKN
jgi:hypothetical protein